MQSQTATVLRKRRQRHRRRRANPRYFSLAAQILLVLTGMAGGLLLVAGSLGAGAGWQMYSGYARQLPDIESLKVWEEEFQTVSIYDRTGEHLLLLSLDPRPFTGDRTYVSLDEMSPWVWKSAIALEDRSFWDNPGFSIRGISRAFLSNLSGDAVQGGSSITQQLIKNIAIPFEERAQRSYARKVKEMIMALELTRKYEKAQILEWYLNFNFYGNLSYGIEAASRVYFGKSSSELSLAEAAMLAPIPQYQAMNPFYLPERAKERQRIALDAMAEVGFVTQEEADAAFAEQLEFASDVSGRFDIRLAPHFGLYVLDQLQQQFNTVDDPYFIWKHGLSVRTTLDLELHRKAESTAQTHVRQLQARGREATNAAVVAIEPSTGEILVMSGSLDFEDRTIDGQVNVALSERQPGSSFKPYVYIAGLEQGMTAADMLLDVRTPFSLENGTIYVPENYDRAYHGPVSFRTSLARSYNIPSIKVMEAVGVGDAIRVAQRLGIRGLDRGTQFYGLSLVLGGGEISLLDHTYAYSVLGNQGVMAGWPVAPRFQQAGFRRLDPISILEITDNEGQVLLAEQAPQADRVLSESVHYIITDILSDDRARAAAFGFDTALTLANRPVAAKTGTTNNIKDVWTLGYTPQLAVGVWVGNTENTPMNSLSGLTGAAPIWNAIMEEYHKDKPVVWYDRPETVVRSRVCSPSGLRPSSSCRATIDEWFVEGTQPELEDNVWQSFVLDRTTGQLANATTAAENREIQYFQILPIEAQDWITETGFPQPPTGHLQSGAENAQRTVGLLSPTTGEHLRFNIDVKGYVRESGIRSWRLELQSGEPGSAPLELAAGTEPTHGETLATLSTAVLTDGRYVMRLVVQHHNGFLETLSSNIFVDNSPPVAELVFPEPNQIFILEDDEQVNMHVEATDTGTVSRAEFWLNNELISTSRVPPFNERWRIAMQDLPPSRFAAGPVIENVPIVDDRTGEVLGEFSETREVTHDWYPNFDSEKVALSRGQIREFADGFAAILTSEGVYLERNSIQIRVFDGAGNETRTPIAHVYVMHQDADPKPQ